MFCVLHADKAKGLQINLSEALQGKDFKAFTVCLYTQYNIYSFCLLILL